VKEFASCTAELELIIGRQQGVKPNMGSKAALQEVCRMVLVFLNSSTDSKT
jgi:hypothetical protein